MRPEDIILTIAIPTYNRKDFLINNVRHLLPQLNDNTKLLIFDNCSDEVMQDILYLEFPEIYEKKVEVIRNITNIGADANIVRCFENCRSPYLWILGDDDIPLSDAVEKIINHCIKFPSVIFFNFSCEIYFRKQDIKSKGLCEFVDSIDDYSNLLFISNNIYKVPEVIGNLRFAYHYIYSCASQLAILLQSLGNSSEVLFSSQQIVNWGKPTEENQWSSVLQSFGYNSLLELPLIVKSGLSKKLGLKIKSNGPSIKTYFRLILMLSDSSLYNYSTKKYLFDQIVFRKFYYYPIYNRIVRFPLSLLLRYPRIINSTFKYYCLLVGIKRSYSQDSYYK